MDFHLPLKKPKLEVESRTNGKKEDESSTGGGNSLEEQEEALIALIAHRENEVNHNKQRLEMSQKKLEESKSQLARFNSKRKNNSSAVAEKSSSTPSDTQGRTQLNIPAVNPKNLSTQQTQVRPVSIKKELSAKASTSDCSEKKKPKRKFEQKEHQELIPSIRTTSSPTKIIFQPSVHLPCQHKRKMRSLVLNPLNDQTFITSALDGVVNLWQLQAKGSSASLLSSVDCMSPKKRWPEDITWHPDGGSLFAVYTADDGDSQISILNHNHSGDKKVVFLQDKPHLKGIINCTLFMPWDDLCFATGGSDHAVILWKEKDNSWKPQTIHRSQHTSSVMGAAGLYHKKVILSVGTDKRIVGYDVLAGRAEFKHQIDSKCMSVLPNPMDFNLFMVQSGQPGEQLRLFDIRQRQTEIHAFGWQQTSSESQSALINQAWSPDGLYLSSGSADPMIHIFDIRYKNSIPSQSVRAHQRRVFKAVWHKSVPLLTSISSDLNIGLHRIC